MNIGIKKKDFLNKSLLESILDTKLKKPVGALEKGTVSQLPFCYEVDLFGEGRGFLCIGQAKEVQQLYKTKRVKGQGLDEQGKTIKVDKKKVAYGVVRVSDTGVFEFYVEDGLMKPLEAKAVIKSIPFLKKTIGEKFAIFKGLPQDLPESTTAPSTTNNRKKTAPKVAVPTALQLKLGKINLRLQQLETAVGKGDAQKIRNYLQTYQQQLQQLLQATTAPSPEETAQAQQLKGRMKTIAQRLVQLNGQKIQLTAERRAKVQQNMTLIHQRLQNIAQKLNLSLV